MWRRTSITSTGKRRHSAIDGRTTRHAGYSISQSCRAMTECIFGSGKQHGTMRKTKHHGTGAVAADFLLNLIAYNLIRIPKLVAPKNRQSGIKAPPTIKCVATNHDPCGTKQWLNFPVFSASC